jgi:hypothetical protein
MEIVNVFYIINIIKHLLRGLFDIYSAEDASRYVVRLKHVLRFSVLIMEERLMVGASR